MKKSGQRVSAGKPRGVLNTGGKKMFHARYLPTEDLKEWVEHFWVVRWDLRGEPSFLAETLPHPSVHMTFENGKSEIGGVHTGKFSTKLEGKSGVFGVKFKPGGFYPFFRKSVSTIKNNRVSASRVFGKTVKKLEKTVDKLTEDETIIQHIEEFLLGRKPAPDDNIELIGKMMTQILTNRSLMQVETIAEEFHITKRSLERLFSKYVGVSPKWVIQRYRLHEAVEQLKTGSFVNLIQLSADLGYFDQAHFIRDFKMLVGKTPSEYAKSLKTI